MVIGIDESGNFDEKSTLRHIFVAAFIETENGKIERKNSLCWCKRAAHTFLPVVGGITKPLPLYVFHIISQYFQFFTPLKTPP